MRRPSPEHASRDLFIAMAINASMGVLYVWSIFLQPLELHLKIDRSDISLVPSVALLSFTVAMMVHVRVIRRLGIRLSAALAFALAAGGHLIFAAFQYPWVLVAGYGIGFGFGAGLGYGVALSLVANSNPSVRAVSIGLVMASFAATGIVLPLVAGPFFRSSAPGVSFAAIGIALSIVGVTSVSCLKGGLENTVSAGSRAAPRELIPSAFSVQLLLGTVFFLLCYVGLMAVSQVTGILTSNGITPRATDFGPTTLTAGYLVGSLVGARLVEYTGGGRGLVLLSSVCALGVILAGLPSVSALLGVLLIGLTFGSTASVFPTIISQIFGPEEVGIVYGRIMAAYGVAGLAAPWISGTLYRSHGDYRPAMLLALAMCILAAALGVVVIQALRRLHLHR